MNDQKDIPKYIMVKVSDRSSFLIGRLMEETELEIVLHFPVVMTICLDDNEELGMNASKWFPFAMDDIVQIPKETIVAVASPKKNIVDHYNKFIHDMPELSNDSLENNVLSRSDMRKETSYNSEYVSSAIH